MGTTGTPPIQQPIFYCRIFASKSETASVEPVNVKWKQVRDFLWGITFIACVTTSLLALLHGQTHYLLYGLLGLASWLVTWAMLRLAQTLYNSRSRPNRDEGIVSRLDWLRERTKIGDWGRPATDKGTPGWVTGDGIYLHRAKLIAWNDLTAFDLERAVTSAGKHCYQIAFGTRPGSTSATLVSMACLASIVSSCIAIQVRKLFLGLHFNGARDDVLALSLATLLSAFQLGYVLSSVKEFLWFPRHHGKKLVALINGDAVSGQELQDFLNEKLAQA